MNISLIRFIIAAVLIMIGILIMVIQTFGVFKLNYALNRMHAAAMGDSLGIMMIVLGMMVIYGISFASLKLLTVLVVFWFASPVCSHLLAKLDLLVSVVIYMAFSLVMSIIWLILESPDLAITEAAVGAGVTSILFFVTLKKIRSIRTTAEEDIDE